VQLLSLGSQYALNALIVLGKQPQGTTMPASELARPLKSPSNYLSQMLAKLIKPGILGSKRGLKGGVYLKRKPSEITMLDIIEAIEGDTFLKTCFLGIEGCGEIEPCPFHDQWSKKLSKIQGMLTQTTLKKLCDEVSDEWIGNRSEFIIK
jgi:Rrf2 family protein